MISNYWLMWFIAIPLWGLIFLQISWIMNKLYQIGVYDGKKINNKC